MFNNNIFIPHVYTTLEAEFQVMKKEVNPVKYTVFLLFCYIYIYKKNELDNDIFGSSFKRRRPVLSVFLFFVLFFFDNFFTFERF